VTRFLRLFVYAALIAAASAIGAQAQTPDATPATKEQAVAMVQRAVAFLKAQGPEKGYAEIDNKSGQFVQGDLYIAVVGLDGTLLAYGAGGQRIGENLIDFKDADGKAFVKERVELAKQEPSFWQS